MSIRVEDMELAEEWAFERWQKLFAEDTGSAFWFLADELSRLRTEAAWTTEERQAAMAAIIGSTPLKEWDE